MADGKRELRLPHPASPAFLNAINDLNDNWHPAPSEYSRWMTAAHVDSTAMAVQIMQAYMDGRLVPAEGVGFSWTRARITLATFDVFGKMHLALDDGRELAVPLRHFPRLRDATLQQLMAYELWDRGICWPALGEYRTVDCFLNMWVGDDGKAD